MHGSASLQGVHGEQTAGSAGLEAFSMRSGWARGAAPLLQVRAPRDTRAAGGGRDLSFSCEGWRWEKVREGIPRAGASARIWRDL